MSVAQLAYGLGIVTNLAIPGLPTQSKQEDVHVEIRLKDESIFPSTLCISRDEFCYVSPRSEPHSQPNLRVCTFADGKYVGFFYSDGVRFAVERSGREIWGDWPENYTLEDACTYLVGPVVAFALRLRGSIPLHASSIAVDGRAIALMGQPGAGKSTTAAAFSKLGYPVLSDDVVVLDDQGDRFLVQPGYPRINLWPDSVRALFGSEDALPHITPTWDKRYLPLDQNGYRFQTTPLPLGAIYLLSEHEPDLDAPVVEDLVAGEAFMTLVANTYVNYLLNLEMRNHEFDVLGRVVAGVPVRRVRTAADPSKLLSICETISEDARRMANRDAAKIVLGGHG